MSFFCQCFHLKIQCNMHKIRHSPILSIMFCLSSSFSFRNDFNLYHTCVLNAISVWKHCYDYTFINIPVARIIQTCNNSKWDKIPFFNHTYVSLANVQVQNHAQINNVISCAYNYKNVLGPLPSYPIANDMYWYHSTD